MKKAIPILLTVLLLVLAFSSQLAIKPKKAGAHYDANNLCTDLAFVNTTTLDVGGIQSFLGAKGSFLKDYSENGRTAAQIIHDAAQANGINPIVILATLQKEEGLIYGEHARAFNQVRMDWAMGYGYTDSVIYDQYKGFTQQVETCTWQFKRNYSYWATNNSSWNVNNTMTIDGTSVTFGSKCTSALYRYTPHLHGNYVFNYYFELWGGEGSYDAQYLGQGPKTGPGSYGTEILPNQRFTIWVNYRNTGNMRWYRDWSPSHPNPVHLGTAEPHDRNSTFMGGKNLRGTLVQSSVGPGQIGTFKINMRAPLSLGTYTETFQPVVEGVKWMGPVSKWELKVDNAQARSQLNAEYLGQGPKVGPGSLTSSMAKGEQVTLWVNYRNTGTRYWYRETSYPTHLGTANPNDRTSIFLGGRNVRGSLVQSMVAPGEVGTFKITVTAPNDSGYYYESFQPVAEYIGWFGPQAVWKLRVR